MDLLLDVDVVVDLCLADAAGGRAAPAIARCRADGGRVWLYTGAASSYLGALRSALGDAPLSEEAGKAADSETGRKARHLLRTLAAECQWLATLSSDLGDLDADHLEEAQHLRALDRFEPGSVKLLALDRSLVERHPDKITTPEDYCARPATQAPIEFIDLKAQLDRIRPQLETELHRVVHHGRFILGPEVVAVERRLQDYTGAAHCITVASGTEALLIALMALGIGPGDEVITTPFTFVATAEVIVLVGARPVFVDIEPDTCNLDATKLEAAITPKTKAIMPVSLYGQAADMDEINAIAAHYNLPVIEDAAQSFGADYRGRKSCNLSTIGCTSFFPSKPLGCYGDGGAIFTSDDALAKAMREIRVHGQERRYVHTRIGVGGRMDTLQCAILLAKLEQFDWEVERRAAIGQRYTELFSSLSQVATPVIRPDRTSVYAQYTLQVAERDALTKALNARGVPTAVHYPIPLNQQPAYQHLCCPDCTPVSSQVAERVFSLPMHPDMTEAAVERIVECVSSALKAHA